MIFTEKREYTTSFKLTDTKSIEYLEIILDAKTMPSNYNEFADGNAILHVTLNDKLPYEGDFGLTDQINQWLRETLGEKLNVLYQILSKSLWLVKQPFGIGSDGIRKVRFNSNTLLEGKNILKIINLDEGKKKDEGDGVWIYNFRSFC